MRHAASRNFPGLDNLDWSSGAWNKFLVLAKSRESSMNGIHGAASRRRRCKSCAPGMRRVSRERDPRNPSDFNLCDLDAHLALRLVVIYRFPGNNRKSKRNKIAPTRAICEINDPRISSTLGVTSSILHDPRFTYKRFRPGGRE